MVIHALVRSKASVVGRRLPSASHSPKQPTSSLDQDAPDGAGRDRSTVPAARR